jgi:hypothetical protein
MRGNVYAIVEGMNEVVIGVFAKEIGLQILKITNKE